MCMFTVTCTCFICDNVVGVLLDTVTKPGIELTNIPPWFWSIPALELTRDMGTGTAILDICRFCSPWRLAILIPDSPVIFWMLIFGGSPLKLILVKPWFVCPWLFSPPVHINKIKYKYKIW